MKARKHLDIRLPHLRIPLWWPALPGNWRAWLPSRGNVLFTVLVVAGLLWATNAGALPLRAPAAATASTGTIAYQGRLADSAGTPLTGTYGMIFRLYDAASGGAPLWEEQWTGSNGVQVSDGLFNVMLGSITPIPQDVITTHDSLFLGITVGTDDEMTPRVQLGSVPFAVQALTVPDGSVSTAKLADGAVTSAKIEDNTITETDIADSFKARDADRLDNKDSGDFAAASHNHDSRYYTESESDSRYASSSHNHDGRYFTESESNNRFVNAGGDTMSGVLNMGSNRVENVSRLDLSGEIRIGGQTFVSGNLGGGFLQIPRKDFDPSGTTNGMIYYNNAANCLRVYANGAWRNLQCW